MWTGDQIRIVGRTSDGAFSVTVERSRLVELQAMHARYAHGRDEGSIEDDDPMWNHCLYRVCVACLID